MTSVTRLTTRLASKIVWETLILMAALTSQQAEVRCWEDELTIDAVTALLRDNNCPGVVAVFDSGHKLTDRFRDAQEFIDDFIWKQTYPVVVLDSVNGTILSSKKIDPVWNADPEPVCHSVAIFGRRIAELKSLYRQTKRRFSAHKTVLVTSAKLKADAIEHLLRDISDEDVVLLLEATGAESPLYRWTADNRIHRINIRRNNTANAAKLIRKSETLSGRHLKIITLSNPPSVIIGPTGRIFGIEPLLLETIADHLDFTYEYIQVSPKEMWGEVFGTVGNRTLTGMLGMLGRKEVDVAIGNFYLSSSRWPYVSYTAVYKISHESFLVPAPRPYPKWTALVYSFEWPIWVATFISGILVIVMLRLVAFLTQLLWPSSAGNGNEVVFRDSAFCCLYVIGNLLNVQMQPQNIKSSTNRMFLIWWLFGTLILTTGYRSGMISHMTFPFTPPAIDTFRQLLDSPLRKLVYGGYAKGLLMSTPSHIEKELGEALEPNYNMTEMYVLLESGSCAVQSNLDNLLYMAATMYPTTQAGPRVHLLQDTILPALAAFGLQKDTQLKKYFDVEIQRMFEAGIIYHLENVFAKKMDKTKQKKSGELVALSMNSLQGAFFVLIIGLVASLIAFLGEMAVGGFCQRRKTNRTRHRGNSNRSSLVKY